jgi:ankyrin repeat protein
MKTPLLLLVLILLSGGVVFQAEASLDSRLIDAAEAGEATEVRKLLSDGASVNAHSPIGKTALMFAAQEGHLGVVEVLFEAANKGHVETVRLLLKQGALPTAVDSSGASPIDYARSNGYQQIVDLLEGGSG